jgi:hypothetical protein
MVLNFLKIPEHQNTGLSTHNNYADAIHSIPFRSHTIAVVFAYPRREASMKINKNGLHVVQLREY